MMRPYAPPLGQPPPLGYPLGPQPTPLGYPQPMAAMMQPHHPPNHQVPISAATFFVPPGAQFAAYGQPPGTQFGAAPGHVPMPVAVCGRV